MLLHGTNYVYCKVWEPAGTESQFNHWWLRTDLTAPGKSGRGADAFVPKGG